MKQPNILKRHLGYWVNRLRNVVHYSFEDRLSHYGVGVAEWSILISIYDGSACSVNDIASYIEIDKASVSRVTERLIQKDLILFLKVQKDNRLKVLHLTEKGKKLICKLLKEAQENDVTFFGCLSSLEIEQMQQIIYKVLQKVPAVSTDCLINTKGHTEMIEIIKNILKEATINKWPYPKTFQLLNNNGLQSYEVYFADFYKARFTGVFGCFVEDCLDGYKKIQSNKNFNPEGIKSAIFNHITKQTSYLDFLNDIAAQGATHYKVNMKQRTVTYFNADETDSYIEYVPEYQ